MSLASWNNSGNNRYDVAVGGIPFNLAVDESNPYFRSTNESRLGQVDTSGEPGEQALGGWWYRSQSTFHYGSGVKFNDTSKTGELEKRFEDSAGVDVFSEAGEVSLLRATETKYSLADDNVFMVNYLDGIAVASRDSFQVWYVTDSVVDQIGWGGDGIPGNKIADMVSDGERLWILAKSGLYRVNADNDVTQIYRGINGNAARGRLALVKDRLIALFDQKAWEFDPDALFTVASSVDEVSYRDEAGTGWLEPGETWTQSHSGETVIRSGPRVLDEITTGWSWWGVADGPRGIYLVANQNDSGSLVADSNAPSRSVIKLVSLTSSRESLVPSYDAASTVAEMTPGEAVRVVSVYLGTYMLIGTSKGFRVAIIAGDGSLVVGPIHSEAAGPVDALFTDGNYCYFGTARVDGKYGLWKADLSKYLPDQSLRFPVAKDIAAAQVADSSAARVSDIARFGKTDRVAFAISKFGSSSFASQVVVETASTLVPSGWLRTARIRFDTAEDKIFQFLRVSGDPTSSGSVGVSWVNESGTEASLGSLSLPNNRYVDLAGSETGGPQPRPWLQYKFTLTRGSATTGPVLLGYQAKAQPANVKQRLIQVPLMCFMREETFGGRPVERSVFDRIQALESAEQTGAVVLFQDFNTGEQRQVLIEKVTFRSTVIGNTAIDRLNPGGVLTVLMRCVS